jgi:hypothetical protein
MLLGTVSGTPTTLVDWEHIVQRLEQAAKDLGRRSANATLVGHYLRITELKLNDAAPINDSLLAASSAALSRLGVKHSRLTSDDPSTLRIQCYRTSCRTVQWGTLAALAGYCALLLVTSATIVRLYALHGDLLSAIAHYMK